MENEVDCEHIDLVEDGNITLCINCGLEISKKINYDKDWKYYGNDTPRCHMRKVEDKSIFKDVDNLGFNDSIIMKANEIYFQVTNGKIYRGSSRKAIIFACIFHAYKVMKIPQSCEKLISIFNLDRKCALKGLKHVNLNLPKESPVRKSYITTETLILEILGKFQTSIVQRDEILKLYQFVKNRSSMLNRSRPNSIAAGLVYYYSSVNGCVDLKEYTRITELSALTLFKISKEIQSLIDSKNN